MVIVTMLVLVAIFAPVLSPYDPTAIDPRASFQPPSAEHWLGTDQLGRDLLSRLIHGARWTLGASLLATVGIVAIGVAVGMVAGYFGGLVDDILMRLVDVLLAFPGILLAIGLVTLTGPGVGPVVLASAVFGVPVFARLARGSAISIKQRAYIEAAAGLGARNGRVMLKHVLPAIVPPVLVFATLRSGSTLLIASGLSFLGLGIRAPAPEWGGMLNEAQLYLAVQPLMAFAPGIAITLAVLGFNLLGDGLRDVLDPTLRE